MILKERIEIQRPPQRVWDVIENPDTMKRWNPNVKHVRASQLGSRAVGFRYRITYALSGKPKDFDAEIVEYQRPRRLVIKLTGGLSSRRDYVNESYELTPVPGGTRLEQTIDIHDSGISFLFRLLIWFIRRFGKPTSDSYPAGVKSLAEGSNV